MHSVIRQTTKHRDKIMYQLTQPESKFLTMMMCFVPFKSITSILNMLFEMLLKHKVEMMREINLSRDKRNFTASYYQS